MKYTYAAEKFSTARSALMLPHPMGEAEPIMRAFHECSLALHNLDKENLDDYALTRVARLEELMSTEGLKDPSGKGLWIVKAERLTIDEKIELARIVDELAYWFDRKSS